MSPLNQGLLPDADTAPFWLLFIVFFGIALLRNQVIYWGARLATAQLLSRTSPRGRMMRHVHKHLRAGAADRGVNAINRWGILAVPISFLMVGSKTIINAAAGVTRMPFPKYLPAMLVGCSLHATIYATVGWAAWTSALAAVAGHPWAIAVIIVLVAAGAVLIIRRRRRSRVIRAFADPELGSETESPTEE